MNNTHKRVRSYAVPETFAPSQQLCNRPVYNPATGITETVPHVQVFRNLYSTEVVKFIPLRLFSKQFREMHEQGIFKKSFMDNDQITAVSIHNTIFIPKISNDFF